MLKILRDFDIYSSILDMFIRIFLQNIKTNLSLSVISVLISFSMNLISKGILQENIQRYVKFEIDSPLTLIGMTYERKKNAHLNKLGRVSKYSGLW